MVQERYREPRVPRADGRTPTSLAGVGATCRRCCQVAVARGDAFAPSPGSKWLHMLCALAETLRLPPALPKVILLRAQDTHQSLLEVL